MKFDNQAKHGINNVLWQTTDTYTIKYSNFIRIQLGGTIPLPLAPLAGLIPVPDGGR